MEIFVSKVIFLRRFFGYKNLLLILFFFFALLTILAKLNPYFSFDLLVSKNIQYLKSPLVDFFMELVSFLGEKPVALTTLFLVTAFLYYLKQKKELLFIFISDIGIYIFGEIIKWMVSRPRPDPGLVIQMIPQLKADSFPSGHVLHFMGFYGFLFFLIYTKFKKGKFQNLLLYLITLFVILIGISRIYLGVHWFSDVLGSYLLGTIWLLIMTNLYYKSS